MSSTKPLTLPSPLRLGWIGTGVMGAVMCGHLLKKSYPITVYTRTRQKSKTLLAQGAQWATSPAEVMAQADVVFTMVGFPQDVREVYFGASGLLQSIRPNTVLIDMTTSPPSLAIEIFDVCQARGGHFIDAPVSGGDVGAQKASLSIMIGGKHDVVLALQPLFESMGQTIIHQGPSGAGQHAKLCNQITIAGTIIGVCESLLYGYRAGLDLDTMLQSIRGGAAACWTLDNLAPRILQRNFDPGFFVEHFVKDMGIALDEAKRMGLALPGLALVHQLYLGVQAHGHGRAGTQALILALEQLSNIQSTEKP